LLPSIADDNKLARPMFGMPGFQDLSYRLATHDIAGNQANPGINGEIDRTPQKLTGSRGGDRGRIRTEILRPWQSGGPEGEENAVVAVACVVHDSIRAAVLIRAG
jgi:hypothetical protein